jgi:hypothetical protein
MEATILPPPACSTDADENVFDNSTAPTSPDGSLTFSPVLQVLKLRDALERSYSAKRQTRNFSPFTDATLSFRPSRTMKVCCIGAGYVGTLQSRDVIELLQKSNFSVKFGMLFVYAMMKKLLNYVLFLISSKTSYIMGISNSEFQADQQRP